jgi:16S rRNA (uracil1498-N3)-methyltransferase
MSRHRLFVPQPITAEKELTLEGELGHYLSRVLRLKPGSAVTLFDGSGQEYPSIVLEAKRQHVLLRPGQPVVPEVESPLALRLIQGVSRGDRMDFVIQKATELGVHRISPVLTEFSVVKLNAERAARRMLHWRKIAQSACEQCGRNRIPIIDEPVALHEFLHESTDVDCRLLLQPSAPSSVKEVKLVATAIELLIGPEGGISDAETEFVLAAGFKAVSLGPRVMRTETAALAAVAIIQALWGDL